MAFVDNEDDGGLRSGFSGKIVGVLVCAAVALAVKVFAPAMFGGPRDYTPDRVRAEIEAIPENRELFGAIRASYPAEYDAFLRNMANTANATRDNWALRQQAFSFTRNLMRIHFEGLARAQSGTIRDIALQYAALYRALQGTDVRLCGQAASTGFTPGAEVDAGARAIISHIGAMQIAAARQGEMRPVPARAAMSDADSGRLLTAIQAHSTPAARLLQDDRAMAAATPEQQCETAIALYEVVGALPPDDAAKATVQLLRASLGSAS